MVKLISVFSERLEIAEKRLTICRTCERYLPKRGGKCLECGCIMDFKALLPEANCPLGKWEGLKRTD